MKQFLMDDRRKDDRSLFNADGTPAGYRHTMNVSGMGLRAIALERRKPESSETKSLWQMDCPFCPAKNWYPGTKVEDILDHILTCAKKYINTTEGLNPLRCRRSGGERRVGEINRRQKYRGLHVPVYLPGGTTTPGVFTGLYLPAKGLNPLRCRRSGKYRRSGGERRKL